MIEIITGDLLLAKEQYICHQTNCISKGAAGIAQAIFDKYPYSDVYSNRMEPDVPGTIKIVGNGQDQRYIVNIFAQYYPGSPQYPLSNKDGTRVREKYFYQCLLRIAKLSDLKSVAFPWKIGCGIGGGNWEVYLGNLTNFANFVEKKGVRVCVYRREGDE